jgi:hypothetical protein
MSKSPHQNSSRTQIPYNPTKIPIQIQIPENTDSAKRNFGTISTKSGNNYTEKNPYILYHIHYCSSKMHSKIFNV